MHALLLSLMLTVGDVSATPPDIVVVCPADFRSAMQPWLNRRTKQGHVVQFLSNEGTAEQIRDRIRVAGHDGKLRFIVLVGEALPKLSDSGERTKPADCTPTFHVESKVDRYWGGQREFASDNPFADLDGDGTPDVAIGRLTARTADELAVMLKKILAYEDSHDFGPWRTRVNCVVGQAGLGRLSEVIGEVGLKSLISSGVPAEYQTSITSASWSSPFCPNPHQFHQCCLDRLNEGALFWVFAGHGAPRTLQWAMFPDGNAPILWTDDCAHLHANSTPPIALCLCCYTGAFAEHADCLAEELLRSPGGPVAVYSGSSVTMPYGMAVMSRAAMREYFVEQRPTLGEWLLWTKRDTIATHSSPVWSLANALLVAVLPPGIDLKAERLEHVQLFNLFGDPTMPLVHPRSIQLEVASSASAGSVIHVSGRSPVAGTAVIELAPSIDQCQIPRRGKYDNSAKSAEEFDAVYRAANNPHWDSAAAPIRNQRFSADLHVPADASGRCHVRVLVEGSDDFALGSSEVQIVGPADQQAPSPPPTTAAAPRKTR
jgi:Peptidase family C25